jgi:hypothetical protein
MVGFCTFMKYLLPGGKPPNGRAFAQVIEEPRIKSGEKRMPPE